jgi:hypothetical protein
MHVCMSSTREVLLEHGRTNEDCNPAGALRSRTTDPGVRGSKLAVLNDISTSCPEN